MVSLIEFSEVTEEGVKFKSPYDGKEILLSPEKSISIQNSLGLQGVKSFESKLNTKDLDHTIIFLEAKRQHLHVSLCSSRVRHHDAAR